MLELCHGAGAYALGLLATLVLACFLTPRHWWRRANARALLILAGGAWGIGGLMLWLAHGAAQSVPPPPPTVTGASAAPAGPLPGRHYRVIEDLNLRGAATVGAPRLAVVPAGALVQATGAQQGDWWQITAGAPAQPQTGWASSLWLRRGAESPHH